MKILILLVISTMVMGELCNMQPYDAVSCISQVTTIACQYNPFDNSCTISLSDSMGCIPYLNLQACIKQLTYGPDVVKCYFGDRCMEASNAQLQNLGCSAKFSKHACLNAVGVSCIFLNGVCQIFQNQSAQLCSDIVGSVSPKVCLIVQSQSCMSGLITNDYQCVRISSNATCSDPGVNKMGCIQITGSSCIYNNGCNSIQNFTTIRCLDAVNYLGCVQNQNPTQQCVWRNNQCQFNTEVLQCAQYKNVNRFVCASSTDNCQFDPVNYKCISTSQSSTCDSPGLSQSACFSFTTPCYFDGNCHTLTNYNTPCSSNMNLAACVSVTQPYQYCQWNGTQCTSIQINVSTSCTLINVNGNSCKDMISSPCKWVNNNCIAPSATDDCSTKYFNLLGCVGITLTGTTCQWNIDQNSCQNISVVRYATKCSALSFANPVACQSVYFPSISTEQNCYYNSGLLGCTTYTNDNTIDCNQSGLNEFGCARVTKSGSFCRFYRGQCITVTPTDLISTPCLQIVSVNAAVCSLSVYNQDRCVYEAGVMSCVTTVNIYGLQCTAPGLNSYGCAALVGQSCAFDYINNICKTVTLGSAVNQFCQANFPSKSVCLAITMPGQLCEWNLQKQQCLNTVLNPWYSCTMYSLINQNVCASVILTDPNSSYQGYCNYVYATSSCGIYAQQCPTTCCESPDTPNPLSGINAHVCSRFSSSTAYCYFNSSQRCQQMTLLQNSDAYAQQLITNLKLQCEQVNYKACHLVLWNPNLYCFQAGLTDRCHSVDFNVLFTAADYAPFTTVGAKATPFTCAAAGTNRGSIYYQYDAVNHVCWDVDPSNQFSCDTAGINKNICTKLTQFYCLWTPATLTCSSILTSITDTTCSPYYNQNACNDNLKYPCVFDLNMNTCADFTSSITTSIGCANLGISSNRTVAKLACSLVIMPGQSCSYKSSTKSCVNATSMSSVCAVVGSNKFYCYAYTSPNCQWNQSTLTCNPITDPTVLATLTCTSSVNKTLCLNITTMACAWDNVNLQCIAVPYSASQTCNQLISYGYQYNPLACTQITATGSFCQWVNGYCQNTVRQLKSCQQYPVNVNSCIAYTNVDQCIFQSGQCVAFSGNYNIPCTTQNINAYICANIIGRSCYFNTNDQKCYNYVVTASTQCSSMAGSHFYNQYACISISPSAPNSAGFTYCSGAYSYCSIERYCVWDPVNWICTIPVLQYEYYTYTDETYYAPVDEGFSEATVVQIPHCNLASTAYSSCSSYYSQAFCLEIVNNACFFDLPTGGCQAITGLTGVPTACENVSALACTQVTSAIFCKVQPLVADGCNQSQRALNQCVTISLVGQDCTTIVGYQINISVCSNLAGYCYFDGNYCQSTASLYTYCDMPGLSLNACADLSTCSLTPPCASGAADPPPTDCDTPNTFTGLQQQLYCLGAVNPTPAVGLSPYCYFNTAISSCQPIYSLARCSDYQPTYISPVQGCTLYAGTQQCQYQSGTCVQGDKFQTCLNLNLAGCQYSISAMCYWTGTQCSQVTSLQAATYTTCANANVNACPYIDMNCWIISNLCTTSDLTQFCDRIYRNSGNQQACQLSTNTNSFGCYWDSSLGCMTVQTANQNCQSVTLNLQACQSATTGYCAWNGSACVAVTSYAIACTGANLSVCSQITAQPCYWFPRKTQCRTVAYQTSGTCSSFAYQSATVFNAVACAWINFPGQMCAYKGTACVSVTTATCSTQGLNMLGCLNVTTDACYFYQDNVVKPTQQYCAPVIDFTQSCTSLLYNTIACLQLTNCYFNVTCKTYDFTLVTLGNYVAMTSTYVYPATVCAQISFTNVFLYYNPTTLKCVDYKSTATLLCSTPGINQQACIFKTSQSCAFDSTTYTCSQVASAQLTTVTNCALQQFSLNACTKLSLASCQFLSNGVCSTVAPATTCASLASAVVSSYTCATRTDTACSYNATTLGCVVQTLSNLDCGITGLNQIGCLQKTTQMQCTFFNQICSQGILTTYLCTDPINVMNCLLVSKSGQYCNFNGTCLAVTGSNLTTCIKTLKVNGPTCTKATDIACHYNSPNCVAAVGTEDCSIDQTLNIVACQQNKGPTACYWSGTQCLPISTLNTATSFAIDTLTCASNVNLLACVTIQNSVRTIATPPLTAQYCVFTTTCQAAVPSAATTCSSLNNVNVQEFCEATTDVPCAFNSTTHSCQVVTTPFTSCQRGLNIQACTKMVTQACLFQTYCYSAANIANCSQAQTLNQCMTVPQQSCKWSGTACSSYNTTAINCASITGIVSSQACFNSIVTAPNICSYNYTANSCNLIQPSYCTVIFNQVSCRRFSTMPCIWSNDLCVYYTANVGVDTCSMVSGVGSQRSCQDINKYGQSCYYDSILEQCIGVSQITNCNQPINYQSCVTQRQWSCIWTVNNVQFTKPDTTVQNYAQGSCTSSTGTNIACSANNSYLTCLSVTLQGQYCIFQAYCQGITAFSVTLSQYSSVSVNVCTIVSDYPAQYDSVNRVCIKLQSTATCTSPGLNKLGCLNISTCRWNPNTNVCFTDTNDYSLGTYPCVMQNVAASICQSCIGTPVQWDGFGNCIWISATATCSAVGVNRDACIGIKNSSCLWQNGQCIDYAPYTTCLSIPQYVNYKVCQSVSQGPCKFSINKCVASTVNDQCTALGLNVIGCVQIPGCQFTDQCQVAKVNNILCSQIGNAHSSVCSQALDNCKYDAVTYKCFQSNYNDICTTPGLSQSSCVRMGNCQFLNGQCQCVQNIYPSCSTLLISSSCFIYDYCFWEITSVMNQGQAMQVGVCRLKKCSDLENCTGYIDKYPCAIVNKQCTMIMACTQLSGPECNYTVNSQLCIYNPYVQTCVNLDCSLSYLCPLTSCSYQNNQCSAKLCSTMTQQTCSTLTYCYWNGSSCVNSTTCVGMSEQFCELIQINNRYCGYTNGMCIQNACRYTPTGSCAGTQTIAETCVILNENSCVACEEITDECTCLSQQTYCTLDRVSKKCHSKLCQSYNTSNCPTTCRVANQKCLPTCVHSYNKNACTSAYNCFWSTSQTCSDLVAPVVVVEQILPEYTFGLIITFISIAIL